MFFMLGLKLIISAKQVCDRNFDCFDASDELLCSNQSVAQALVVDEALRCLPGHMHCNSSTECVAMDKVLCNFSVVCKQQINQKFCLSRPLHTLTYHWLLKAKACQGMPLFNSISKYSGNRPRSPHLNTIRAWNILQLVTNRVYLVL